MPRGSTRTVQIEVVARYLYAGQIWILTKDGQVFRVNKNRLAARPAFKDQANRVQDHGKLIWSALAEGKKDEPVT
jgi:hypothetical protein